MYGPMVLASDEAHNPQKAIPAVDNPADFKLTKVKRQTTDGYPLFEISGITTDGSTKPSSCKLLLTPYYAAGSDMGIFNVWMKRPLKQ
jgi:hypothetical protein